MIPEKDLIWFAGVTDSIGRIHCKNDYNMLTLTFSSSKRPDLAPIIAAMTGVQRTTIQLSEIGYLRRGCVEHCPEAHIHVPPRKGRSILLKMAGARAYTVLWNLYPYLRVLKSAAEDGMDHYNRESINLSQRAQLTFRQMLDLGWEIPDDIGSENAA